MTKPKFTLTVKSVLIFVSIFFLATGSAVTGYKYWDRSVLLKNVDTNLQLYNQNLAKVDDLTKKIDDLGNKNISEQSYSDYLNNLDKDRLELNSLSLQTNQLKAKINSNSNPKSAEIADSILSSLDSQVSLLSAYSQGLGVINCVAETDQQIYENGLTLSQEWQKISLDTTNAQLQVLSVLSQDKLSKNSALLDSYKKCFTKEIYNTSEIVAETAIEQKYIQNILESIKKVIVSLDSQKKIDFDSGVNEITNTLKGESKYQKYIQEATLKNLQDVIQKQYTNYKISQDTVASKIEYL